jgi:glycosyltransferase involved in cell wall biosynthesis
MYPIQCILKLCARRVYKMKISVVIPTYNRERLLKKCLISLYCQSYPRDRFEVIVINDGGRDFTWKTIKLFAKDFNLIWLYQKNKGQSTARNLGIRHAKNEIIAFIDDDCVADKDWLQNISNFYKDSSAAEIVQGSINLNRSLNPINRMHMAINKAANEKRIIRFSNRSYALFFGPPNGAIKKSSILKYGLFFDEALRTREDVDLYRRIKKLNLDIMYSEEISVAHTFQWNPELLIKRFFTYGMGEYCLRQKWQSESYADTPNVSRLVFSKLIAWYGLYWALLIYITSAIRSLSYCLGFEYEKFRHKLNLRP